MNKPKKNQNGNDFNIWQPTSDMLTGLMLILLLVILLLILLMLMPHEDDELGDTTESAAEYTTQYDPDTGYTQENDWTHDTNDNAGGGGTDVGDYPEDEGIKSAVYVRLIDADTNLPLKEEGVTFELYSNEGTLEKLNTYYPEKITYDSFETREDGTFYLPEKIYQGRYFFHQTSEIEGYENAADTYFDLDDLYDWPDPYVVNIYVHEYRNAVRIQLVDKDTGLPVTGAAFTVTSSQDIDTEDGYKKGDVVDTITVDENGYGESRELYIGEYTLNETTVPEYYARITDPVTVTVEKLTDETPTAEEIETEKTGITISVTDEASGMAIEGASFTVRADGGETTTVTTDSTGTAKLTDLEKGTSYVITQTGSAEDYQFSEEPKTVTVSSDGLVAGTAAGTADFTNRMIRVQLGLRDKILRRQVAGESMTVYDASGTVVDSWTTDSSAKEFTDLTPGSYYMIHGTDASSRTDFTVENTPAVQSFDIETMTPGGYGVIAGVVAAAAAAAAGLVLVLVRRRRNHPKGGET